LDLSSCCDFNGGGGGIDLQGALSYNSDIYNFGSSYSNISSGSTILNADILNGIYVPTYNSFTQVIQGGPGSTGINGSLFSSAEESKVTQIYDELWKSGNMVEIYNSGQASDIWEDAVTAEKAGMNLNIVGYSWGGQTALQVANILNDLSTSNRINFLFTIDAVCLTFSCPMVPGNVNYNFNYFQNYGDLHGAENSAAVRNTVNVQNFNMGTTGHDMIVNAVSGAVVQTITTNDPTVPMRIYGAP
jgi:hypothetical protein